MGCHRVPNGCSALPNKLEHPALRIFLLTVGTFSQCLPWCFMHWFFDDDGHDMSIGCETGLSFCPF
jgi:hypothetical protein